MKHFFSENIILKLIIFLPIFAIVLTSAILTNIFIETEKTTFANEIKQIKREHNINLKRMIKERVDRTIKIINAQQEANRANAKEKLKDIVQSGYYILESTYEENKHQSKEAIFEVLKHTFRNIRFFKNKSGYFFIYDLNGVNIVLPPFPHLEGKNLLELKDPYGKKIIKETVEELRHEKQRYKTWYWWKENHSTPIKKLGFYKRFDPLNVFIGTGEYYDDIENKNLKESIALLEQIQYQDEGYIFVINDEGTAVIHKNQAILNKPLTQLPVVEQKIVKRILKKAKQNIQTGAYIEYEPTTQGLREQPSHKISYVKYIPSLKLTIGTGLYTQDLQATISQKTVMLEKRLERTINKTILSAFFVTLVLIIIMVIISSSLKNIFNLYAQTLEEKNKTLKELNNNLAKKVALQVAKNRQKDEMLHQQSKMAAMGEMLGNIAHQWRQPLSAISTAASGIKIQDEMNTLNKNMMYDGLDAIVKNTQLLSQTIDDFRNFFKTHKTSADFSIEGCFSKVFTLIHANLNNKSINVIQNIDPITLVGYENELIQALLNILNNSRDALLGIDEEETRYIFIRVYQKDTHVIIEIKDNAKGIDEKILPKIFEPYFTTKHQSQGTGIGLYMTKQIIESSLLGSIRISNVEYTYEKQTYKGTLNEIRLPLKL